MRRAVSEFPNDNPELHDGLVWSAPAPCAPALPTLRLRAPSGPPPRVMAPSWVELVMPDVVVRPAETPAGAEPAATQAFGAQLESIPEGPFARFVSALAGVALARGATRAAANLPGLFGLGRAALESLEPATLATLRARGIVEHDSARPTAEFSAVASAWRDVLEGTGDFSRCGDTTLDAWAATVLGALMNTPRDRSDDLRRELRKRGVAAFGLLAA